MLRLARKRPTQWAVRLVMALGLGLLVSGCDKCGDFPWSRPGACKNYSPSPR
jgi:hypothetical protein